MQDVVKEADIVKFIKLLSLRWFVRNDRVNNTNSAEGVSTARMEGIRKRGRPRKRWTDENEEDLIIRGIQMNVQ
jgi:hypothetical protein